MRQRYCGTVAVVLAVLWTSLASAQQAPLTREEILDAASRQGLCGAQTPVEAWVEKGQAKVRCGSPTAFVPVVGALSLGGGMAAAAAGIALIAAGAAGGAATPSTE